MLLINKKKISIIFIFIIYASYFLGFFLNENSIGSGGIDGDFEWMWKNFELFKNNSLIEAIHHKEFFGNRTPLLYLINILFNPFINDIYLYRLSIFLFSLMGPTFFYLCLKKKYRNIDKEKLLLIASLILLSPFYRTTAYWGMEINYGIITALVSFYYFISISENKKNILIKNILFLVFFSSITVYFDQKLVFIPLIAFFKIILIKNNLKIKIWTVLVYFLLSIPYLYLFYIWGGLVPLKTQMANPNTITSLSRLGSLYYYHLGYASTIIGFYLFPFLFLKENSIQETIKKKISLKINYVLLVMPIIYIIFLILNYDFSSYTVNNYWVGLGWIHKISILLFNNLKIQEIFTYIAIFFSWLVIVLVLEKEKMIF